MRRCSALLIGLAVGCSGPTTPHAPPSPDPSAADAGHVVAADAAAESGADAARDDGSVKGDAAADAGPVKGDAGIDAGPVTYRCAPGVARGTRGRVDSVAPAGFDRFGGVSADELTVAWSAASGTVFIATRASVTDPFGPPTRVDLGAARAAPGDRVALAPSGNAITVVAQDRRSLLAFARRGGAWMADSSTDLSPIAAVLSDGGSSLGEPVLAAGGRSLFYLVTIGGTPSLYESQFDPVRRAWSTGRALGGAELASLDAARRRRPTGGSSDGLTLFYFDEVRAIERAAWRPSLTAAFNAFEDLPGLDEAAPSGECEALYYVGADPAAGGRGLSVAEP